MQIVLINPPFSDPMMPPTSLPVLAESLASSAEVQVFDLNIEVFNNLFTSSGSSESVEFLKKFQAAFHEGVPAVLKMKEVERRIQAALNTSAGGLFNLNRDSFEHYEFWPPSLLSVSISQFSSSMFGKTLESAVIKILPSVIDVQCVGISVMYTSQVIPALIIAQVLRREGYQGVIVLGGVMPTYTHEYLGSLPIFQKLIDLIFIGELFPHQSEWFVNYCLTLSQVSPKFRSLKILQSGLFEASGVARFPPELTSNGSGYTHLPLSEYWGAEPHITLAVSVGCYHGKCAFCGMQSPYRCNSPEQAIQRMMSFQEKIGVSVLSLEGGEVVTPKMLKAMAQGLKQQRSNLTWHAIARFENELTRPILEHLYEGGCRSIFFGLESASHEVLQRMGKRIQLHTVERILRDCAEIGLASIVGVFFGFPGETDQDALLTLDFIERHSDKISYCAAETFQCLRNSPIGRTPETYGIEIVSPGGYWIDLLWKDSKSTRTLKDPQKYVELIKSNYREEYLLTLAEFYCFVCKYGVKSVKEQLHTN